MDGESGSPHATLVCVAILLCAELRFAKRSPSNPPLSPQWKPLHEALEEPRQPPSGPHSPLPGTQRYTQRGPGSRPVLCCCAVLIPVRKNKTATLEKEQQKRVPLSFKLPTHTPNPNLPPWPHLHQLPTGHPAWRQKLGYGPGGIVLRFERQCDEPDWPSLAFCSRPSHPSLALRPPLHSPDDKNPPRLWASISSWARRRRRLQPPWFLSRPTTTMSDVALRQVMTSFVFNPIALAKGFPLCPCRIHSLGG